MGRERGRARAALPHSEKGKRAFAGRLVQAGMKKAAHRSLRRRETEAIDVIRGLSALGSFDRSAECRFSSNKRQRHRLRVTLATDKDTHVPAHYILLARATSKIYGPSVYRRPNETFQESFGLFAGCQTISCRPPPTNPFRLTS